MKNANCSYWLPPSSFCIVIVIVVGVIILCVWHMWRLSMSCLIIVTALGVWHYMQPAHKHIISHHHHHRIGCMAICARHKKKSQIPIWRLARLAPEAWLGSIVYWRCSCCFAMYADEKVTRPWHCSSIELLHSLLLFYIPFPRSSLWCHLRIQSIFHLLSHIAPYWTDIEEDTVSILVYSMCWLTCQSYRILEWFI